MGGEPDLVARRHQATVDASKQVDQEAIQLTGGEAPARLRAGQLTPRRCAHEAPVTEWHVQPAHIARSCRKGRLRRLLH